MCYKPWPLLPGNLRGSSAATAAAAWIAHCSAWLLAANRHSVLDNEGKEHALVSRYGCLWWPNAVAKARKCCWCPV